MRKKILVGFIIFAAVCYIIPTLYLNIKEPVIHWDWQKIDTDQMQFPDGFVWGVASAAHQVEGGHTNNNFSWWETQVNKKGEPCIARGQKAGLACDHWHRYAEDIGLMKELGVTSYRFSVSWSKIMPSEFEVDSTALNHYVMVCDSLLAAGINPMVTLHHFTHPMWFEKKGAFTKEENIDDFVRFSGIVFLALKDRVKTWCTINEPAVYAVAAYFDGNFPPGIQDPEVAATALKNLYLAHVAVYKHLKSLPGGENAKIGIVKNMHQIDPMSQWNLFDRFLSRTVNKGFNGSFITTFRDGYYRFHFPSLVDVEAEIPDAPGTLDFVGLNYYSHNAMDFSFDFVEALKLRLYPGEIKTDMDYTIYPEGLYRAIVEISEVDVPIMITENGIADSVDDRRGQFISRYLYAISKAIDEGYDVKGYHYWSLMDNFEWDLGYDQRFGLYHVDFKTQKRTLREGAKVYQRIMKAESI